MRLGTYLSSLTKPEITEILDKLNLTEEDNEIFALMIKNRSYTEIADRCCISVATVNRRVKVIKDKLHRLEVIK